MPPAKLYHFHLEAWQEFEAADAWYPSTVPIPAQAFVPIRHARKEIADCALAIFSAIKETRLRARGATVARLSVKVQRSFASLRISARGLTPRKRLKFDSRRVHTPFSVEELFWGENAEIISPSNLTLP